MNTVRSTDLKALLAPVGTLLFAALLITMTLYASRLGRPTSPPEVKTETSEPAVPPLAEFRVMRSEEIPHEMSLSYAPAAPAEPDFTYERPTDGSSRLRREEEKALAKSHLAELQVRVSGIQTELSQLKSMAERWTSQVDDLGTSETGKRIVTDAALLKSLVRLLDQPLPAMLDITSLEGQLLPLHEFLLQAVESDQEAFTAGKEFVARIDSIAATVQKATADFSYAESELRRIQKLAVNEPATGETLEEAVRRIRNERRQRIESPESVPADGSPVPPLAPITENVGLDGTTDRNRHDSANESTTGNGEGAAPEPKSDLVFSPVETSENPIVPLTPNVGLAAPVPVWDSGVSTIVPAVQRQYGACGCDGTTSGEIRRPNRSRR
ncbi:MAG: hypothetical protein U0996_26295 [Planctomycetaceae bacterium]